MIFFFSSRRRHTSSKRDWSSDVCSYDLVKKDEWTAYSDKVKSDLEVPAKRHMKSVEVPTGEKSMFGLGKEIMKTEKKPTKNVVISERDYKNLVTAARDNDRLKQHV